MFLHYRGQCLAFTIYGVFAYSIIASLYLFLEKNLTGHRLMKGLKYGLSCCAIWIIYLWEPLPHVHPLDRITYPLIDSAALLVMGLLLYLALDIYSSFETQGVQTLVWTVSTGIVVASVVLWYKKYVSRETARKRALLSGLVLFGVDLLIFNFFMPLVFAADIPDLMFRTLVDILAITAGLVLLTHEKTNERSFRVQTLL